MQFMTKRFAEVTVPDDKVIRFENGLPGLPAMRSSVLIKAEETAPFYWLQSVEDGDIAIPVINPLLVDEDYAPSVEDSVFEELMIDNEQDLLVVNVAVLPEDLRQMTANMAAPILINIARNIGRQVVLESGDYQVRQSIFEAVSARVKEEQ